MNNDLIQRINSLMVNIPKGEVVLRDDRIKKEWQVQIKPFLLAKYVVTMELYDGIINSTCNDYKNSNKPVVNISWHDAITFVIHSLKQQGLQSFILYKMMGKRLVVTYIQMAIDYRLRQSGNTHVKQIRQDIHMENFRK